VQYPSHFPGQPGHAGIGGHLTIADHPPLGHCVYDFTDPIDESRPTMIFRTYFSQVPSAPLTST
jgi:hypothetical protein